jgi:hypothetical protein
MPASVTLGKRVHHPDPFKKLDAHINDPDDNYAKRSGLSQLLQNSANPGFDLNGGPLVGDMESLACWNENWTDAAGHGGSYWPYLTHVNVAELLKSSLVDSIARAKATGKIHNTLWIFVDTPPEGPVDVATQRKLIKTEVVEGDGTVTLAILTPYPRL